MNPHYHHSPYPEMNSPHSPHSDGVPIGYHGHGHGPPQCSPTVNGHIMAPHRPPHLDHLHSPHPAFTGGSGVAVGGPPNLPDMVPNPLHHHHHHPHHHPHHHMINSTTNTNTNNNSNNNNANNNSTSNNSNSSNSSNNNNSISSNLNSNMMVNGGTGLNGPNSNASSNGNNGTPSCVGGVNPIMNKLNTCSGCGRRIVERYLLHALDRYWHHSCLKCQCCGTMLADIESSCFTRNDMILCRADYLRLYGNTGACAACGVTIPGNELVMRIGGNGPLAASGMPSSPAGMHHVFHPKCFLCSKCGTRLTTGDRYYLLSGNLVCEQDWHKLLKTSGGLATATGQPNTATGTTTVRKGKVGRPRRTRE